MLQKGRPFQIGEEEYYEENMISPKPMNERKMLPSMMLLLITFTNNPNRPTSSQVQAKGWSKSTIQGRPCGGAGKCPHSAWAARASLFHITSAYHISSVRKYRFHGMVRAEIINKQQLWGYVINTHKKRNHKNITIYGSIWYTSQRQKEGNLVTCQGGIGRVPRDDTIIVHQNIPWATSTCEGVQDFFWVRSTHFAIYPRYKR